MVTGLFARSEKKKLRTMTVQNVVPVVTKEKIGRVKEKGKEVVEDVRGCLGPRP
jgi:hypothetical protein